ncbi:MAG TPA: radical SAM protein [Methanomassiliicoccales archaeon]|nr:radical SAM protein [Methanomassiliicoccales archaeon]
MKLIGLEKEGRSVNVRFYGCPLHCPYCTHLHQPKIERSLAQVLEVIADPKVEEVYLGGAEPTIQKNELLELLERLHRMNRRVTLKTSGSDPATIKKTLGMVHKYIVEVKCPFDNVRCASDLTGLPEDKARRYQKALRESLEELRGREVRIWVRVIPGYADLEGIETIGRQVEGVAKEALLIQFLAQPENDAKFGEIEAPGPEEAVMVAMARKLLAYVPIVSVRGRDFKSDFHAGSR